MCVGQSGPFDFTKKLLFFKIYIFFYSLCFYPSPQRRTSTSVYSLNTFDIKWKLLISAPSQMCSWLVIFLLCQCPRIVFCLFLFFLTPTPLTSEEDNYGLLHFARYLVCFMKIPPATVRCTNSGQVSLYSALCVDKMDLIFISAGRSALKSPELLTRSL